MLTPCTVCGLELSDSDFDNHDCQYLLNIEDDVTTSNENNFSSGKNTEHSYSKLNEEPKLLDNKDFKIFDKYPKTIRKKYSFDAQKNKVNLGAKVTSIFNIFIIGNLLL